MLLLACVCAFVAVWKRELWRRVPGSGWLVAALAVRTLVYVLTVVEGSFAPPAATGMNALEHVCAFGHSACLLGWVALHGRRTLAR